MQRDSRAVIFVHYGTQWRFFERDLSSWKKFWIFSCLAGTVFEIGHFYIITTETPSRPSGW